MTPLKRYQKDIAEHGFQRDEAQHQAVVALDKLYHDIVEFQSAPIPQLSKWQKLMGKKVEMPQPPKGLYFWGGVGRGKTYLMDAFFDALPTDRKMRVHFHRFMYRVHDELKRLGEVENPLSKVAYLFKQEADIVCFDEFFVSDITDAMILATLLQEMFKRQMVLVATSNIEPQNLYRNGLQRARFLPAIDMILASCHVLNVDSGVDYRLRTLEQAEIYHFPLDEQASINLNTYYQQLTAERKSVAHKIDINHRQINVIEASDGVLHASFEQLCQTARSQNDYIELSRIYHTVLLADVRQMNRKIDDAARRFIALVDEFYERNVKLIISAEVEMDALYTEGQLEFEFKRCVSRLTEMQSHEYLAREHLA
ncbi:cell division protein ZapE [Vibrio parahaemolyticus]|uniref:cell division protein ZapE n=2 Tax=Vibrio parahaemolyticus TaxID=670 RepID=UPI0004D5FA42|nr:cell division protein ZapE [Vibrio parahaemolyticus]ATI46286.1 cell division protein ZapE [Vibrio parahaemolyticus]AVW94123.1 cell division protein ZapE [Vibrio parahaemolyticus]EGQ8738138.1 cell division protein ZapE [Vibrio parahaemolyticus]EGQ8905038.1 cell division protein ZapE [Vibrio parahaemolyticus]EGR2844621.1 cell division protein ZapE [Vibrio parahaemolyticus]